MSDIVCVGKFDALHRGHRALVEAARPLGMPTLLRFTGMPQALGWAPRRPLVAETDRPRILDAWRAQERLLPFDAIRACTPPDFVAVLAQRLGAAGLVIGEDFRGGPGRTSDAWAFAAAARDQGWQPVVVPLLTSTSGPISSSRIRSLLAEGQVEDANQLLGRSYRLGGPVVIGDGRGRQIGVPTANIQVEEVLLPRGGVYAAWADIDGQRYRAAVNLGTAPTVGEHRPQTCEAHLLDFSGDLYGRFLALDLVARLRDEVRFPSLAALVAQIQADLALARSTLV